jgi:hypothetical protein
MNFAIFKELSCYNKYNIHDLYIFFMSLELYLNYCFINKKAD